MNQFQNVIFSMLPGDLQRITYIIRYKKSRFKTLNTNVIKCIYNQSNHFECVIMFGISNP